LSVVSTSTRPGNLARLDAQGFAVFLELIEIRPLQFMVGWIPPPPPPGPPPSETEVRKPFFT
jgi:hypothetical protein